MTTVTVRHEHEAGVCTVDGKPHHLFKFEGDWVCYKCTEPYVEEEGGTDADVEPQEQGQADEATGEDQEATEEAGAVGGDEAEDPVPEEAPQADSTGPEAGSTVGEADGTENEGVAGDIPVGVCNSCGLGQPRMVPAKGRKKAHQVCTNCDAKWKPTATLKPLNKQGSVVVYPDRGPWGDNKYRGNTSGYLIRQLVEFYSPTHVFDPMSGGGTTQAVCEELHVPFFGRDIRHGHDDNCIFCATYGFGVDFIFWHPPYHSMVKYGIDKDAPFDEGVDVEESRECNLSLQKNPKAFVAKLEVAMMKLVTNCLLDDGVMCVQVGDMRKAGKYSHWGAYVLQSAQRAGLKLDNLIVKQQSNVTSAGFKYKVKEGNRGFVPINHEFVYCFVKPVRKVKK